MAFQVELDVNAWGAVQGSEDLLPVRADEHDWWTAYPPLPAELILRWTPGNRRQPASIHWYPPMSAWVCDQRAIDVLHSVVSNDIHVLGPARVDGEPAWVVQIVTRLENVVDDAASLYDGYPSYQIMRWPSFLRTAAGAMSQRLFRVPEMHLSVFMGAAVRAAMDEADITGLRFVAVDWTDDREWTVGQPFDESAVWSGAVALSAEATWPRGVPVGVAHLASLLRFDRSMRERGLLHAVARHDADQIEAASVAADYLARPELAEAIRTAPQWTRATVGELEARYGDVSDASIRAAFARRFQARPDEFR